MISKMNKKWLNFVGHFVEMMELIKISGCSL
jgi:hypothetical protein